MITIIAALALVGEVPATAVSDVPTQEGGAPSEVQPLAIWNDLRVGMTKDQVRALYPDKRTPIAEGCFADISGVYEHGKLSRVGLESPSEKELSDISEM